MSELLVLAYEHTQFVVIDTYVLVKHPVRNPASVVEVFVHEGEHHVGVVHRRLSVCLFRKAVVVVVWLDDSDDFVNGVVELVVLRVVGEHLPHLLLRESHHLVELVGERIVCADVESACEVVECHGTDAGDENPLDRRFCT